MGETAKEYLSDTFIADRNVYESTLPDKKSGILRTIKGPVAEWGTQNRNKRVYSEKLWDNVLSSPYVVEQLKYKTLYGEANHPTERYEVDFGRVSHSITDMWKVPASNQIFATINILDTPLGRILETLYEAGGVIGYSSRAGGTLHQKKDYIDVDENTYNFITFDAVPFPSVVSARPDTVVEGVEVNINNNVETLSEEVHDKLCGIINESSVENREIVKEFIYNLRGYDFSREKKLFEESDINMNVKDENINNDTAMSLLKESSSQIESLKVANKTLHTFKKKLEDENHSLRSSLNSSISRISELNEQVNQMKRSKQIDESGLDNTITKLRETISELEETILEKNDEIQYLSGVRESFDRLLSENKSLNSIVETFNSSTVELDELREKVRELESELSESYSEIGRMVDESIEYKNSYQTNEEEVASLKDKLQESLRLIESLKEDKMELIKESRDVDEKLDFYHSLESENSSLRREIEVLRKSVKDIKGVSESYKEDLVSTVCSNYGINPKDVREKLPEDFTKMDILCVCEEAVSHSNSPVLIGEEKVRNNSVNDRHGLNSLFVNNRRGI